MKKHPLRKTDPPPATKRGHRNIFQQLAAAGQYRCTFCQNNAVSLYIPG